MEVAKRKGTFPKPCCLVIISLLFPASVWAKEAIVRGTVKDADGEPIIGANVVVRGTSKGSITDIGGN